MRRIVFLFIYLAIAREQTAAQELRLPFKDQGACPFECCQYGEWTVQKATKLRSEPNSSATYASSVTAGDTVTALSGEVVTFKAGQVEILKPMKLVLYVHQGDHHGASIERSFKPGEILSSLHYAGEGFCLYWHDGLKVSTDVYCLSQGMLPEPTDYKVLSEPQAEWWIKIQTKSGVVGWTDQAANFGNKDACG